MTKIQGLSVYGKVARIIFRDITITEVDITDRINYPHWLTPDKYGQTDGPNPYLTEFITKRKNSILGIIQLVRLKEESNDVAHWIFALKATPGFRGMGVGKGLVTAAIEKVVHEGGLKVSLKVNQNNYKAIRLYDKTGFELKKNQVPDNLDRVMMTKKLTKIEN